jgi:hypothetical protein
LKTTSAPRSVAYAKLEQLAEVVVDHLVGDDVLV